MRQILLYPSEHMSAQPDLLQSCLQQAAQAAWPALERCMEDAAAALQVAETQSMKLAERDALAAAWRGLLDQQAAWRERYPAALLALFQADAAQAPSPRTEPLQAGTAARLSLNEFSLVDDADVAQAIESSRLLQQILPVLEHTLAELDTLMSSVQGLPNVRPDLNPLRPEAFAQALRELVAASAAEPASQALWLRYLADPLGRELLRLYERIVNQLELAQVRGASYRVLPTPASAAGRRGNGRAAHGTGSGSGTDAGSGGGSPGPGGYLSDEPMAQLPSHYADLSDDAIQRELLQDFLFNDGSRAHHGLAPAYYATIEEELTALKAAREPAPAAEPEASPSAYRNLPAPERAPRPVDVRSPLSQQLWGAFGRARERAIVRTQLKKDAKQVGQVLGLEVVRKLVGQVAQDPRLLPPLREAIVALEPSLLRLAMRDPRFYSDERHAGRRLLERVAQRSFKYNDEFSSEFVAFFHPVAAAFNALNGQAIDDTQPFEEALAALQDGWDGQDQLEAQQRQQALQALRFAEERQTLADQIAQTLSARSDLDKVPGLVLDFLFGPWALAMAHAKLADTRQQVDPLGFGSVVPDLLWSVKREVTMRQPAKLIAMIPQLLGQLQAGLQLLGQQPRETEAFFAALMNLHRPVLKLRRLKSQQDAEEPDALPTPPEALVATPEQRRAKATALPWLARDELNAAGFVDTRPTALDEPAPLDEELEELKELIEQEGQKERAAAATAWPDPTTAASPATDPTEALAEAIAPPADKPPTSPAPDQASSPGDTEALLLSLRPGGWVDLYSRQRWLRAQLVWASSQATLFMFVSHGGQAHSMTRRSCERLIKARLLRPVETHGVVAQALDGVLKAVAPPAN
jgi:hypothetical protein